MGVTPLTLPPILTYPLTTHRPPLPTNLFFYILIYVSLVLTWEWTPDFADL